MRSLLALSYLLCAFLAVTGEVDARENERLPLAFVANRGQLEEATLFRLRDGVSSIGFERGAFWVRPEGSRRSVRFRFEGADPKAPQALGEPFAKFHYLRGGSSDRWIRDVPAHTGVHYEDLYPGIDLIVYAKDGSVEYDVRVAPGAELGRVRVVCEGADRLEEDAGDLIAWVDGRSVRQKAPVSWETDADGKRWDLPSRFLLTGSSEFGFEVDGRDPSRSLTVDPVLVYTRYLGGGAADAARGVAVDLEGNAYVAGWSVSDDFPLTEGAFDNKRGGREACVFKLALDGSLVWATYVGGRYDDQANAVAVDRSGSVVLVGKTKSSDFPVTRSAWRANRAGVWDAFVLKLDPTGSKLSFGTFLGGADNDEATGVCLGPRENIFVTGTTRSRDFPCTSHTLQSRLRGISDAFVTKLDRDGVVAIYSTLLGGTREELGRGITVGREGHAVVVGSSHSLDFPTTRRAFDEVRSAGSDAFVSKLAYDGAALMWSSFLGGDGEDQASAVALGVDGTILVAGSTASPDFPSTGGDPEPISTDAFVSCFSGGGTDLKWSRLIGTKGIDAARGVAVDIEGGVWVAGQTNSAGLSSFFPTQEGYGGGTDGFLARFAPKAGELAFLSYIGGAGAEGYHAVAVDRFEGRVLAVGDANDLLPSARGLLGARGTATDDALVSSVSLGICGLPSQRRLIGSGCGASLSCEMPHLGKTLRFDVAGATPDTDGVLLVAPPAATPLALNEWCNVYLDLTQLDRSYLFRTDRRGRAEFTVDLPADNSLCGMEYVFQAVLSSPEHGPLPFGALSQPLLVLLGD